MSGMATRGGSGKVGGAGGARDAGDAPGLREEIGKRRPFESPEEEAYLNLLRTLSVLSGPIDALFRAHGLSEPTYNVLRVLRGEGPPGVSCGVIGQRLVARVPDVTRLVDRLEGLGLAARLRTPEDRRVVLVSITRPGLEVLARLDGPLLELHRAQLGHLGPRELGELSRLLVRARRREDPPGGATPERADRRRSPAPARRGPTERA